MQYPNIYTLFRTQTEKYGDKPVFYTRGETGWDMQTWAEFENKVHDLACGLLAKGLSKGSSVAILAGNISEWTICDIGAIAAGGVGVGIYPTSSVEQSEFVIAHSDAEFVIVDTVAQLAKVEEFARRSGKVKETLCIEDGSFTRFLKFGRTKRGEFLQQIEETAFDADIEDIAIMVYTSGTTGVPKGAMLSHKYILNSVESLRRSVPIFENDVAISYLPGCHVAERISGIYNRLHNGTPAYFINDLGRLYEYMLDIKPTVFASLPRFFEKIHAKVVGATGGGMVETQDVKDAFGRNIRLLTSGGAPLPLEIADFFESHDLPILQAYGLTENICVAFNTVAKRKFGTVGKPMPMCKVRVARDGEILVKSAMMFSGYYKEPGKTAEMFNANGWLKTGDLGELDDDGYLKITGRKKEIIVLSSGKNVAPALVENFVKESHLISHCFLFGDGHSYCVAMITLNSAEAAEFAGGNTDSLDGDAIRAEVDRIVAKANARVSSSEQIKKYTILDGDFSAEADEITPTMKLKRNVVAAHYKDILEKLYDQS
ncbi:long-chain fatty acid--CoA ligase [soil metagenome]